MFYIVLLDLFAARQSEEKQFALINRLSIIIILIFYPWWDKDQRVAKL